MKKKLVLVGNYVDKVNRFKQIQSFDFIVRYNRMNTLPLSGIRTDLLLVDPCEAFFRLVDRKQYRHILYNFTGSIILSDNYDKDGASMRLDGLVPDRLIDSAIHLNMWDYICQKDSRFEYSSRKQMVPNNAFILLYWLIENYSKDYDIHVSNMEKIRSVPDWNVHQRTEPIKNEYYDKWEKEGLLTFLP